MKFPLKIVVGIFAIIGMISTGTMLSSKAYGQEKEDGPKVKTVKMTAPSAKISPVQAMKIATDKSGGKAGMAMFEFEDGHWIYGVVIAKKGKLMEAEIDATTGKLGDVEDITASGEGMEFSSELTKFAKSAK